MSLKIAVWNCQSVNNKKSELLRSIEKHNIDIVLLSETWLNERSSFDLNSFVCYRLDRVHGGVAILIKRSVNHSSLSKISEIFADAIFIKIKSQNSEFTLGAIYCSPAASRSQAHSFFSKVLSLPGRSIIAGDFNAKNIRWNCINNCRKGFDLVKLCDSRLFNIHSPDSPTLFASRGNPTTVDFVLSKAVLGVSNPQTVNELSSDHLPITFNIPFDI
jgi:endonuclease/exonuclease/phosphatase family metal-dependent hydrolase